MDNQMSLLEEIHPASDNKSTLHICLNDKKRELTIEEIFDVGAYSRFVGVTFSISPSFMNKYLADFSHLEIVVGIQDNRIQQGADNMAKNIKNQIKNDLQNESVKLYHHLSTHVKKEIAEKNIEIKVPLGYSIHSKFYLLSNEDETENRIIIGSANLSEQAFNEKTAQFENIIIYDNHPLYDIYKDYYHKDLSTVLVNYFPKELLALNEKRLKNIESNDDVIILSNEETEKIQSKSVIETFSNIEKKLSTSALPDEALSEIKNIDADRWEIQEAEKKEQKIDEIAYTITKESISPRAKKPQLKKAASLSTVVKKQIEPLKIKVSENSIEREILYSKTEVRNTSKGRSGLLIQNETDNTQYIPFGKLSEPEEIRNALQNINSFIETFENYTFKYNDEYGQRIMEAILYAFTSPFLYEIKRLSRTSEERNDIPQFLFVGGTAGSGKSSLLKMISKMLGIYHQPYLNFPDLAGGTQAKKARVNVLHAWVSEENVCPILVDELSIEFFSQHNYGKQLILETTNNKIHHVPPFPTIIGTTNADGYTLPAEARRRSYYLKIDKVFDPKSRETSPLDYQKIYEKMDNTLFLDFVLRMSSRLEAWEDYSWNYFGEKGEKVDFLYQTREIFREYYKMVNMPLPRYFPTDRYSDDFESNQEKWRKLYKGTSGDSFKYDESLGHLFFKTTVIDENSTKNYRRPESDIYKEALPQYVVHGSLSGIDIELDTKEFFKWLEIENPYENYYKNRIIDFYYNHKELIEFDKTSLKFPTMKLADNKDLIKRYEENIPSDIILHIDETVLELDKDKFFKWTNITEKTSFLDRIFKK